MLWHLSRALSEKNGSLFVWRHLSAKQKILSPRPRRLCGENVILDKYDLRIDKTYLRILKLLVRKGKNL